MQQGGKLNICKWAGFCQSTRSHFGKQREAKSIGKCLQWEQSLFNLTAVYSVYNTENVLFLSEVRGTIYTIIYYLFINISCN